MKEAVFKMNPFIWQSGKSNTVRTNRSVIDGGHEGRGQIQRGTRDVRTVMQMFCIDFIGSYMTMDIDQQLQNYTQKCKFY